MNKMFEVHIYGSVPECLDVPAATAEAACALALEDIINRLEFKAYPPEAPEKGKKGDCQPIKGPPPRAKEKRKTGGDQT